MDELLRDLPRLVAAHLRLSLLALFVGSLLSVPLGILASRSPRLERGVLGVAAALQTVPSLALLALMVPLLGALGLRNIGFFPAFLALTLYSTFPILQSTVVGLRGVDAAVVEAARAVGMSPWQQLWRVELPLALPVLVSGLRTSAVWTVGAATLATPVGAASLGNYIFSGLQTRNLPAILLGCVASALLALLLDGLGRLTWSAVRERKPMRTRVALGLLTVLVAAALLVPRLGPASTDRHTITLGSKTFTEQYILSEVLAARIERVTGLPVVVRSSLGSSVAFDALTSGSIDAYVDYTGTIWATVMKRREAGVGRAQMLVEVRDFLLKRYGVHVLASLGFENSYALAMPSARAQQLGLRTISDLTRVAPELRLAADYEFLGRPEWRSLEKRYGLAFAAIQSMDAALMYQAAQTGAVDVVAAFSTDGRLVSHDMVVLEDDLGVIPPYDALVLGSRELVARHPDVARCLQGLAGTISAERMRRMNREVDDGHGSPASVARHLVEG